VFKLRKSAAGHAPDRFRYICVPDPYLLRVQRWIHANILTHVKCHESSAAYHPDSKIRETASLQGIRHISVLILSRASNITYLGSLHLRPALIVLGE
jgi:hypothetical protein